MDANNGIKRYALYLCGCLVMSFGIAVFLRPANVFSGGIPGIAIVLLNIIGQGYFVYLGFTIFALQTLFIGIQLVFGGKIRMFKGMLTAVITSSLVQLLTWLTLDVVLFENVYLMSLLGSMMVGTGIALVLNAGFNFIGIVGVAELIARKAGISPGLAVLCFDTTILVSGFFIVGVNNAVASALGVIVISRMINLVTASQHQS